MMRPTTSKRLRIGIMLVVAVLVAMIATSAAALANEEPNGDGHGHEAGSLCIEKVITGDNPEELGYRDFCVQVRGPDDFSWEGCFDRHGRIRLDGLSPGEYCVRECDPGYPFEVSGGGCVEVGRGETARLTIVNNGSTTTSEVFRGSLRIFKVITGDNPEELECTDFSVMVTGPNDYMWTGPFSVYPGDSCEVRLGGLEPGEYTVTEVAPGYPFTPSGGGTFDVVNGQRTHVTITNTGQLLGSLLITKTITGDNPEGLTYEDFTIVVTGPAPESTIVYNGPFDEFGEVVLNDLVPGMYTVTEEALGYPWTIEGNGPVEVVGDEETVVEIINTGSTTTSVAGVTTTGGTGTTAVQSETTVFGFIAQPDSVQTGGGGTAGGTSGVLIMLILSSTLLASVLVASAIGVRAGVL